MGNLRVSGGVNINLLANGDTLNTVLNATAPLYQTFKKGTNEFSPNWGSSSFDDALRPIIYPRVYSVMEAKEMPVEDIVWKYNGINIQFDASGESTSPDIVAGGKLKKTTHNGTEALKIMGNIASETNNDSDTISFTGNATVQVSAEITLLIEEASSNLYRLFMNMTDDVIDGDETHVEINAVLYHSGVPVLSGVEYVFSDVVGTVFTRNTTGKLQVTRAMVDSELLVVCKANVDGKMVAQEQRQVWDALDPYTIVCDRGSAVSQKATEDLTYYFTLFNARTGNSVSGQGFTIKVYKTSNSTDISSQFTIGTRSVVVTGAKLVEHKALYVDAQTILNQ